MTEPTLHMQKAEALRDALAAELLAQHLHEGSTPDFVRRYPPAWLRQAYDDAVHVVQTSSGTQVAVELDRIAKSEAWAEEKMNVIMQPSRRAELGDAVWISPATRTQEGIDDADDRRAGSGDMRGQGALLVLEARDPATTEELIGGVRQLSSTRELWDTMHEALFRAGVMNTQAIPAVHFDAHGACAISISNLPADDAATLKDYLQQKPTGFNAVVMTVEAGNASVKVDITEDRRRANSQMEPLTDVLSSHMDNLATSVMSQNCALIAKIARGFGADVEARDVGYLETDPGEGRSPALLGSRQYSINVGDERSAMTLARSMHALGIDAFGGSNGDVTILTTMVAPEGVDVRHDLAQMQYYARPRSDYAFKGMLEEAVEKQFGVGYTTDEGRRRAAGGDDNLHAH